jgi:hypothetical protein
MGSAEMSRNTDGIPTNDMDFSVVMYACDSVCEYNHNQSTTYTYSSNAIPTRPFKWNSKEYWAWWKGYIACNQVTAEQMLRAIEEDRK